MSVEKSYPGFTFTQDNGIIMEANYAQIEKELNSIVGVIVDTVPTEQIYLFGSYAYGKPNVDSDIDLYVVLKDDTKMREVEAMDAIGLAIFDKRTRPVDVLTLKSSRFSYRKENPTLERKVAAEGIKIYG